MAGGYETSRPRHDEILWAVPDALVAIRHRVGRGRRHSVDGVAGVDAMRSVPFLRRLTCILPDANSGSFATIDWSPSKMVIKSSRTRFLVTFLFEINDASR